MSARALLRRLCTRSRLAARHPGNASRVRRRARHRHSAFPRPARGGKRSGGFPERLVKDRSPSRQARGGFTLPLPAPSFYRWRFGASSVSRAIGETFFNALILLRFLRPSRASLRGKVGGGRGAGAPPSAPCPARALDSVNNAWPEPSLTLKHCLTLRLARLVVCHGETFRASRGLWLVSARNHCNRWKRDRRPTLPWTLQDATGAILGRLRGIDTTCPVRAFRK